MEIMASRIKLCKLKYFFNWIRHKIQILKSSQLSRKLLYFTWFIAENESKSFLQMQFYRFSLVIILLLKQMGVKLFAVLIKSAAFSWINLSFPCLFHLANLFLKIKHYLPNLFWEIFPIQFFLNKHEFNSYQDNNKKF